MQRYWRIYRTFFVSSFVRELEFRANFVAKVAQNLVWSSFFLFMLLVIYRNTDAVAGWTRGEAFVLAGTCFLMNALFSAFCMSLVEIPGQVRMGTLDFVITKPVDTQFWVSTRKFNFDQIGTFVAGIAVVIYGLMASGHSPSAIQWFSFSALVLCSVLLFYAFNLALMTTGIWLVRVDNLWVLGECLMQIARYPLDIYRGMLQRLLLYAVPLGFIATIPTKQIVREFDAAMLALGIGWAAFSFALCRSFWNFALRHYGSASS